MTATNHALTGLAIGAAIHNPALALPLSLLSHFVLDLMPHYGRGTKRFTNTVIVVDAILFIVTFLVVMLAQPSHLGMMLLCGFVAYLPDVIWIPHFIFEERRGKEISYNRIEQFLHDIQWGERPWGLIVDIPVAIFTALLVVRLS